MKKYLALKASAGSGKTFALTTRYICLLLNGAKPNEILTLTFTNKAANEMSERIYKIIIHLGENEDYLNAIIDESKLTKEKILSKKNTLIKLISNDSLSIFTIDKFINKILREFCSYIGISDDFEIKNDNTEKLSYEFLKSLDLKTFENLVELSLYENKKFNSIFNLFKIILEKNENINIPQIDPILIQLQKNNILKIANKIKETIQSYENITNSAKKALEFERFEDLFEKTWITRNTLEEYQYFKKYSNEINENYFKELKKEFSIYYKISSSYSLNKIFDLFYRFKNLKFEYNKNKNYLEFNDVTNLVFELLTKLIDKDFLYFRLDSSYSHILIDEFQDTSILQFKILKPLIDEIISGNNENFKTFFYVGDPKQSIYRFRGGKRELFDYVIENSNGSLEVKNLNTNYRSCKNIIDFVNKHFLNLKNYDYNEQKSVLNGGYVEVISNDFLENDEKFECVIKSIEHLINNKVAYKDIAILTYTNDDILALYHYLKQKLPNINIFTEMTSKLINQQNVKAVINALKYIYFKENIYKENLNSLLGNNLFFEVDLTINLEKKSMQEIIKEISSKLNIIDENVISLIEISSKFNNIVDFIYEIDNLETNIENEQSKGLQLLTIFKSKGLEFQSVILLDRLKRKNFDKSSILFEYKEIELKNIYYKLKSYENFDYDFKNALLKEQELSNEDEINILYVALTRAKNNLIIIKKEGQSVFDKLNITTQQIGNIIQSEVLKNNNVKNERVIYSKLSLGVQENKIKQDSKVEDNFLYSKYFGLATHYCLEMLNNFNLERLNYSLKLTHSRFFSYLSKKDFDDIKIRLKHLLNNAFFNYLIKDSYFTAEQSLIYKEEIKIIDLLIFKENTYYILDYKTTKEEQQEHTNQVLYYKKAIQDIFKTSKVKSYLIYLRPDDCLIKEV